MIWNQKPDLELIDQLTKNTLAHHLGITIDVINEDSIEASMPVNQRTKQPMGLLHGGASAVLSESIGSIASFLIIPDITAYSVVGLEINAHHIKAVRSGKVYSITKPIKIGRTIHLWNTDIFNEERELICTSRLTTMIIKNKG